MGPMFGKICKSWGTSKKEFHLIRLVVWCGSDGMDSLSFFFWGRTEKSWKGFYFGPFGLQHLEPNSFVWANLGLY